MVTTYVLAGYDWNGAFKTPMTFWRASVQEKKDVVILYPKPNQTMQQIAAQIKPPANIIVECHGGSDGSFGWGKDSAYYYADLFQALPRKGIQSVTINGCYSGSALDNLQGLPDGTILQSRTGAKVAGWGGANWRFAKEVASYKEITPLSIMLEALDATDPAIWKKEEAENNAWIKAHPQEAKKEHLEIENINPNDVLPHTIGIGGHPPILLDLNQQMVALSAAAKAQRLDQKQFQRAIDQVKEHFDPNNGAGERPDGIRAWIGDTTGIYFGRKNKLDEHIDAVAAKLKAGADTSKFTLEEKRIAYALTIANLYDTGAMQNMVSKAAHPAPPPPPPPPQPVIAVDWTGEGSSVTANLQAIAEKVFGVATDRGGAFDNTVDGIGGRRTRHAIRVMEDYAGLSHTTSEQELLQQLMHDPLIMGSFGKIKDGNGQDVANIVLNSRPRNAMGQSL